MNIQMRTGMPGRKLTAIRRRKGQRHDILIVSHDLSRYDDEPQRPVVAAQWRRGAQRSTDSPDGRDRRICHAEQDITTGPARCAGRQIPQAT